MVGPELNNIHCPLRVKPSIRSREHVVFKPPPQGLIVQAGSYGPFMESKDKNKNVFWTVQPTKLSPFAQQGGNVSSPLLTFMVSLEFGFSAKHNFNK